MVDYTLVGGSDDPTSTPLVRGRVTLLWTRVTTWQGVIATPVTLAGDVEVGVSDDPSDIDVTVELDGSFAASIPNVLDVEVRLLGNVGNFVSDDPQLRTPIELDASFPISTVVTDADIDVSVELEFAGLGQELILLDTGTNENDIEIPVTLTGEPSLVGTRTSPAFVLFDGTHYLARSASDTDLNGSATFSIAVVFDPELIESGTTGVVCAKNDPTGDDRGWRIEWNSSTGFCTVAVYTAGDGADRVERTTADAIFKRSVLVFTYDDTTPTLELYVNGSSSQGAQTDTGTPGTPNSSGAVFTIGAEDDENGGSSPITGAVYLVAAWDDVLSSGEAATIDAHGSLPPALDDANLVVFWDPLDIKSSEINDLFAIWEDEKGDLALIHRFISGAQVPYTNPSPSQFPRVYRNNWNIDFNDTAGVLSSQNLTSTYASSSDLPTRKLYNGAATVPNIASGWRDQDNDLTLILFGYKQAGTNNVNLFRCFGLELNFDRTTNRLFCVKGDDNAGVGNPNDEYDFGAGAVPGFGEDTTFSVVLRFNAVDDDLIVDVNGLKYFATVSGTNDFSNGTGIDVADEVDYISAAAIPACLSDAQLAQVMVGFQPALFRWDWGFDEAFSQPIRYVPTFTPEGAVGDAALSAFYAPREQTDPEPPDELTPTPFEQIPQRSMLLPSINFPYDAIDFSFVDNPYPVQELAVEEFDPGNIPIFGDPLPTIVSVVADVGHNVVAIAQAGPTDAGDVFSWWEVELVTNDLESVVQVDYQLNNFSSNRQHTDTFVIPPGQDWQDKRIRFVVQASADGGQIWRSLFFRMEGDNFNNDPDQVVTIPGPSVPTTPPITDLEVVIQQSEVVRRRESARAALNVRLSTESRYKLTGVFEDRSRATGPEFDLMSVLSDFFRVEDDFRVHRVSQADVGFPERIAVRFFGPGSETLWWTIAYLNAIVDPETDLKPGDAIVVPPRSALQTFRARRPVV